MLTDDENSKRLYTAHHIIPSHELYNLLKETKNLPKEARKQVLNEYLNRQHIKSVIIENKLIDKDIHGVKDHGRLILASFVNNPNNLVYGPGYNDKGKSFRGKEPGDKKDSELAGLQTDEHKNKTQTFETKLSELKNEIKIPNNQNKKNEKVEETVKAFGDIPKTETVDFKKYDGTPKEKGKLKDKFYAKPKP